MSQTLEMSPRTRAVRPGINPLRMPLPAHVSAQVAWARLVNERLSFLVVVEGGGGRMLGVVTRESLMPGPCCVKHGAACSVVNHRAPEGAFCFADEDLAAIREAEESLALEYPYPQRRSVPLIVVDRRLRPVGYLGSSVALESPAHQSAA